jgi:hypothetical protein
MEKVKQTILSCTMRPWYSDVLLHCVCACVCVYVFTSE